jgi:hypothetical protein
MKNRIPVLCLATFATVAVQVAAEPSTVRAGTGTASQPEPGKGMGGMGHHQHHHAAGSNTVQTPQTIPPVTPPPPLLTVRAGTGTGSQPEPGKGMGGMGMGRVWKKEGEGEWGWGQRQAEVEDNKRHMQDPTKNLTKDYSNYLVDRAPFLYHVKNRPAQPWVGICLNQKAGSSMWKQALVQGWHEQGMELAIDLDFVHGAKLKCAPSLGKQLAKACRTDSNDPPDPPDPSMNTSLQYTLVRHPTTRLLSGYLDKVMSDIPTNVQTRGYDHKTGFAGFIKWITALEQDDDRLNNHFRLQSLGCGFPDGYQYHVLRSEEIGHWYREVVCRLGLQNVMSTAQKSKVHAHDQPCFLATRDCGCTVNCGGSSCNESQTGTFPEVELTTVTQPMDLKKAKKQTTVHFHNTTTLIQTYYTDELAQMVNDWARADLMAFGYKPWLPGENISLKPRVPFDRDTMHGQQQQQG